MSDGLFKSVGRGVVLCALLSFVLVGGQCETNDGNANQGVNANDNGDANSNANDNVNQNENINTNTNGSVSGPGDNEVFIEFSDDSGDREVARAVSGNSTEYALFGQQDASGQALGVSQIDLVLPSNVAVRVSLDSEGKPVSFLSVDDSALLFDFDEGDAQAEIVFVATNGQTSQSTFIVPATGTPPQSGVFFCDDVLAVLLDVIGAVFAVCGAEDESQFCTGSIAQAALQLENFCSFTQTVVDGLLPSGIGRAPSLAVPLGATVSADSLAVAPEERVELTARVFGGVPPVQLSWAVVDGPILGLDIEPTGDFNKVSVSFPAEGLYTTRLTVIDSAANIAFFDLQISVAAEPGELTVSHEQTPDDEDPFKVTLTATPSGGARPYSFQWQSLDDGPGTVDIAAPNSQQTEVTFSAAGTHGFVLSVSDARGIASEEEFFVIIVDPETTLIAAIQAPPQTACAAGTVGDACIELGDIITLQVALTNQEGDAGDLDYTWVVTSPSGESPQVFDDATLTIDTALPENDIPGTWVISVSVTDTVKGETSSDQITLQVLQVGNLDVVILTESQGKVGEPLTLIAQVTGFVGMLEFAWVRVDSESTADGLFDQTDAQAVQFTPTSVGTLVVQVTVIDTEFGTQQEADAQISIQKLAITGIDGPCSFDAASNTGSCSVTSEVLADFGVFVSADTPETAEFAWTVSENDDTLTVDLIPGDGEAQDIQLLATGDGSFTLKITVSDPDDDENVDIATLAVTSECLDEDDPDSATAFIDDGSLDGVTAALPGSGDTVQLDCESDVQGDVGRNFEWRRQDSLGGSIDLTHANPGMGAASFVMPSAVTLLDGGLVFDCLVSNAFAPCDVVSNEIVVFFEASLIFMVNDDEFSEGMIASVPVNTEVTVACVQDAGSAGLVSWSQLSGEEDIDLPGPGEVVSSFTFTPTVQGLLEFECTPSIEAPDQTVLLGDAAALTISVVGF